METDLIPHQAIIPDQRFGIELQDKVRQEYTLFGRFRLRRGMIMWEIELGYR